MCSVIYLFTLFCSRVDCVALLGLLLPCVAIFVLKLCFLANCAEHCNMNVRAWTADDLAPPFFTIAVRCHHSRNLHLFWTEMIFSPSEGCGPNGLSETTSDMHRYFDFLCSLLTLHDSSSTWSFCSIVLWVLGFFLVFPAAKKDFICFFCLA